MSDGQASGWIEMACYQAMRAKADRLEAECMRLRACLERSMWATENASREAHKGLYGAPDQPGGSRTVETNHNRVMDVYRHIAHESKHEPCLKRLEGRPDFWCVYPLGHDGQCDFKKCHPVQTAEGK